MARPLWDLLEQKTGQHKPPGPMTWLKWVWQQEFKMNPAYPAFKGELYAQID